MTCGLSSIVWTMVVCPIRKASDRPGLKPPRPVAWRPVLALAQPLEDELLISGMWEVLWDPWDVYEVP